MRLLQREQEGARAVRQQNQSAASAARRASTIRYLPWQPARRSRKSPPHARGLARTMSAPRFPDTSGPAVSKSGMESSTPRSRQERNKGPRSDKRKRARAYSERSLEYPDELVVQAKVT